MATSGYMPKLHRKERQHLAWILFHAESLDKGIADFYERHAEAYVYERTTIHRYSKSADCTKDRGIHRKEVVDNLDAHPYLRRPERLAVLMNLVRTLINRARDSEKSGASKEKRMTHRDYFECVKTTLSTLAAIATEYAPYEEKRDGIKPPITEFQEMWALMQGLPEKFKETAFPDGLPKPGLDPPTKQDDEEEAN